MNFKYISITVFCFILTMAASSRAQIIISDEGDNITMYEHQLDKQNESKILEKLQPEVRADLLKVKELDPEKYQEMLFEATELTYEHYFIDSFEKDRMETSKKVTELELQTRSLSVQYEHANEQERSGLTKNMRVKLEKLFDLKEQERRLEVEMLEKELVKLKESLEVRKKNKTQIINRRISELTGMGDYLDW